MTNYYATFTETNDNEGETWRFYIPVEGNEEALNDLYDLVVAYQDEAGYWASYDLSWVNVTEEQVDDRVSLGDGDYMPEHNKLSGVLTLPSTNVNPETAISEWFDDNFYKGGIKDYVN